MGRGARLPVDAECARELALCTLNLLGVGPIANTGAIFQKLEYFNAATSFYYHPDGWSKILRRSQKIDTHSIRVS